MYRIKSGIENPSKSEVIDRCGGDEKTEWPRRTDKSPTLKLLFFQITFNKRRNVVLLEDPRSVLVWY